MVELGWDPPVKLGDDTGVDKPEDDTKQLGDDTEAVEPEDDTGAVKLMDGAAGFLAFSSCFSASSHGAISSSLGMRAGSS